MYGLCFADSIDGLGFPVVPVGTEFSPGSLEVLSIEGVVESSALINIKFEFKARFCGFDPPRPTFLINCGKEEAAKRL